MSYDWRKSPTFGKYAQYFPSETHECFLTDSGHVGHPKECILRLSKGFILLYADLNASAVKVSILVESRSRLDE